MKYNHLKNLEELDRKAFILNGYDYSDNDPYGLAEAYFQFCQTNLSEKNIEFNIQPARMYIRNETSVNALAAKRNDYFVVGVNIGTVITMHNFFTNREVVFSHPAMAEFEPIHGKLDLPLSLLMYQVCTQFTYYHELAHLIQLSSLNDAIVKAKGNQPFIEIDEVYEQTTVVGAQYSLEHHLKEFDADLHGAHFICLHLLDYWRRLDKNQQTKITLELLLSMGLSAVFSYFIYLLQKYTAMYYKEGTHPHPLIRIIYILDMFIKTLNENLPAGIIVNESYVLNLTFRLSQMLFTFGGGIDRVQAFAADYAVESKAIEDYINKILISESKTRPELVQNRLATMSLK